MQSGYFRQPTIAGSLIVFVCEDDLWSWTEGDKVARRLSAGAAEVTLPRLSPDGETIAFVTREEGHPEVATMPALGGPVRRLTFLGGEACLISGWTSDGAAILFASDAHAPFSRETSAYSIPAAGGTPRPFNFGPLRTIAISKHGTVIGRNADDPARWKRYRGGTAGDLWVDAGNTGTFARLITVPGNPVSPMWIDGRVFFLSDHEGIGNIYSCAIDGSDLKRHTDEQEYYVRYPSTDGKRIVYAVAGAIKILDPRSGAVTTPEINAPSSAPQTARRFVDAGDLLETFAPSPGGERVAIVSRGMTFTMPLWEEAVIAQAGEPGIRTREAVWLHDGKRLAYTSDAAGNERLEVRSIDGGEPRVLTTGDIGRVTELIASPSADTLVFANHRHELGIVDVESGGVRIIDRSPAARISDLAFSPDGRYVAYAASVATPPAQANPDCSIIRIAEIENGELHDVTSLLRSDRSPAWDPEGKYLYFLSTRDFNPVYDALQFDLSFPQAARPFVVTLRRDVESPFVRKASPIYKDDKDDKDEKDDDKDEKSDDKDDKSDEKPAPVVIDFEGISGRVIGFPVDEGDYGQIVAARNRAIFTRFAVRGIKPTGRSWDHEERGGELRAYDFEHQRCGVMAQDVGDIIIGADHRTLVYRSHEHLRVIDATGDLPEDGDADREPPEPSRKSGWLDLSRIEIEVVPLREWTQMYHEAWRLQREQFWVEDMSEVDWERVRDRYARLLPQLRTRTELSDLIWEMQGELGTSHAYEIGGDHRKGPSYRRGFLGADIAHELDGGYRVERILRGDSWDRHTDSPLAAPGIDVLPGDFIAAVNGRQVNADRSLDEALVNTANADVTLTIKRGDTTHHAVVRTLRDERALRYRAWVEANRTYVHEATGGRVGYLHIPDMGPWGFSEFHRGFLSEFNRNGLIIDVRHNRGGHVSPLLLEKLARKRVGYDVSRYGPPIPYPPESVGGPMVGLTDQWAGSDGDIFSHCFKLYGLGPLVGKRTWGGVIGINPYHELIDGTVTTQPEFSFWFSDVGWGVENYGTDPHHDVDIAPQDTRAGHDPQMALALELIGKAVADAPAVPPPFTKRPSLKLP